MNTSELFEMLYADKIILNRVRNITENRFARERADRINALLERRIFDQQFIDEIDTKTPYSEVEQCYLSIVKSIIERVPLYDAFKSKGLHVLVTGGIDFRSSIVDDAPIIILEWPIIKFIDFINTNVTLSDSFEHFQRNSKNVVNEFLRKYKYDEDVDLFTSQFSLSSHNHVQYQLIQLLQQIQTVFILSHELAHQLNPGITGQEAETCADEIAFESVLIYCSSHQQINLYIVIGIMLLFSYLTLLDVAMKENREMKIQARDSWLDRYDLIIEHMNCVKLTERDEQLIVGYDKICSYLDELCLYDIEEADIHSE